jgi:hypothetical protein
MPNWCDNSLTIRGKRADVEACLLAIRGEPEAKKAVSPHDAEDFEEKERESRPIDFERIVPMPKSLHVDDGSAGDDALVAFYGDAGTEGLENGNPFKGMGLFPKHTVAMICERNGVGTQAELQAKLLREHPGCKETADAYAENIRLHGHKTWYNWSIEHWGTKWNAADGVVELRETKRGLTAKLRFDTAWSPPTPVMHALVALFPKLSFAHRYWEQGACYQGKLVGKGGEVVEEGSWDYHGSRGG